MSSSNLLFIFVSGGVLSGVGKGIITASVALLLKSRGLKVSVVKCENYLNIDSGLINPIEHGDPFLCEDGAETDMDIGTYEKFLNQDFGKHNFVTMGQIYGAVIERERNFGYRGEDVEAIPHVTDEIERKIRLAAEKDSAEIVIVELGGTVGEYQNVLYYETARILQHVKGERVIHIHVGYLPTPPHIGEPKTKPTQLSVKTLNSLGIQPDFIVARSEAYLDQRRRERFALFCSVKPDHIMSAPDVENVYTLPIMLYEQGFDRKILAQLGINSKPIRFEAWEKLVKNINKQRKLKARVAIVGKYFMTGSYHLRDSYAALYDALEHASLSHEVELDIVGVDSQEEAGVIRKLKGVDGIIVPIGWGERGVDGKLKAIEYARQKKIPYLGLCYGMQLAVVEFARNVVGLKAAHTTEVDPKTPHPVVHMIPDQERIVSNRAYGGTMRLGAWDCIIKPKTQAFASYTKYDQFVDKKKGLASERHRHRYEFNNAYTKQLEEKGLVISARSVKEQLVEMIELPKSVHPFFVGTQGHPEYKSRPLKPHGLFLDFVRAAVKRSHS